MNAEADTKNGSRKPREKCGSVSKSGWQRYGRLNGRLNAKQNEKQTEYGIAEYALYVASHSKH